MMHGRYRYGSIRAGRPVGYAVHARRAIGAMFRIRRPPGAKEKIFVRLSKLAVHRHVDYWVNTGR